jgi:murein DD-endopeptidase MepM/ murein hydrolase activator NlpD
MKHFIIIFLILLTAGICTGQSISDFRRQHKRLLAKQENINKNIVFNDIDHYRYHRLGYYSGDKTYADVYREHWESDRVNPYEDAEVPSKFNIELGGKYAMPCSHYSTINSKYGYRKSFGRMHKGIDLKAQIGDTIRSAFDGQVRLTKFDRSGYGFYVVVRHYNNTETVYGHLSKFLVKSGQYVKVGQPIALSGNTGRSTGPHLHFEVRYMGYAINPEDIFNFKTGGLVSSTYMFVKAKYNKSQPQQPSNASNTEKSSNSRRKVRS